MKRDVKVGLLVAAVICGVAAILLGGGLAVRPARAPSALRVQEESPAVSSLAEEPPSVAEPAAEALPEAPPEEAAVAGLAPKLTPPVAAVAEVSEPVASPTSEPAQELPMPHEELPIAPPAEASPLPPPARHVYVVQEGESFYSISKKLFGTVRYFPDIQRANPDIDPKKLRPGMRVAIPEIPGAQLRKELLTSAEPQKPRPRVLLAQDTMHVVQPGEVLEDISLKYYGTRQKWRHILRANPSIADAKALRPGQEIIIPALTE